MKKVKEFLMRVLVNVQENGKGVLENYPYTVGVIFIMGMAVTFIFHRMLGH